MRLSARAHVDVRSQHRGCAPMGLALPEESFSAVRRFGYGSNAKQNV